MRKLSVGQKKIVAEIFANIAVAWFAAGVISPLLVKPENIFNLTLLLAYGLLMTVFFAIISLFIVQEVKT